MGRGVTLALLACAPAAIYAASGGGRTQAVAPTSTYEAPPQPQLVSPVALDPLARVDGGAAAQRSPQAVGSPLAQPELDPRYAVTEDTLANWMATCDRDPGVARELWRSREDIREAWATIQRKCWLRDQMLDHFYRAEAAYLAYKDPALLRSEVEPLIPELLAWGVDARELDDALDIYQLETANALWTAGEEASAPESRWELLQLLNSTERIQDAAALLELVPEIEK